MNLPIREHITGLTIAGLYYLLTGNEVGAGACWHAAVQILPFQYWIRAKRTTVSGALQ